MIPTPSIPLGPDALHQPALHDDEMSHPYGWEHQSPTPLAENGHGSSHASAWWPTWSGTGSVITRIRSIPLGWSGAQPSPIVTDQNFNMDVNPPPGAWGGAPVGPGCIDELQTFDVVTGLPVDAA